MLRSWPKVFVLSAFLTCWSSNADAVSVPIAQEIEQTRANLPSVLEFRRRQLTEFVTSTEKLLASWEKFAGRKGLDAEDRMAVEKTTVEILYTLGNVHIEMGNFAAAEPFVLRAIQQADKLDSTAELEAAFAYTVAGKLRRLQGKYPEAIQYLEKARSIRKAWVVSYWGVALLAYELAQMRKIQGDFKGARELIRFLEGGSQREAARGELASVELLAGDYQLVESLVDAPLKLLRNDTYIDPALITSLGYAADYYLTLGSPELAEAPARMLLERREKMPLPIQLDIADACIRLSRVNLALGELDRAIEYADRGEKLLNGITSDAHPARIPMYTLRGEIYIKKGDPAAAKKIFQQAHSYAEKSFGSENYHTAKIQARLGAIQLAMGDDESAYTSCSRAAEVLEKTLGPTHPDTSAVLDNLARVYMARNQPKLALPVLRKAMDGRDRHAARIFGFVSELQKTRTMDKLRPETDLAVRLARNMPNDDEMVKVGLTAVLRRKGRVLDGMAMSRAALRDANSPDEKILMDQIVDLQKQIVDLIIHGPLGRTPEDHRKMIRELNVQKQKLEAQESRMSQRRLLQENPLNVVDVAEALPKESALVEYSVMPPSDTGDAARYVAWVLFPDSTTKFVDLGPVEQINLVVSTARKSFADVKADPKGAARALDAAIMLPIRRVLGKTKWLFVSPDGDLNLVPFGALRDESGQWLVDTYSFTYLTSGRDLMQGQSIDEPEQAGASAVFFGNADFGEKKLGRRRFVQRDNEAPAAGARAADLTRLKFTPLAGTAGEVAAIEKKIPGARVFLGEKATEAEVKSLEHPRILHLATHGFFLPDKLLATSVEDDPSAMRIDNPLVRSGLALAGANLLRSGEEDGVLTAFEAAGLDLYGTKLVVLSACETGIGEARSGEGVYGLRRALAMAGAETTVMSLWQVDDLATRDLMVGYYDRLLAGGGRAESLRQAALTLKTRPGYEHPFFWASFIVSGDGTALSGKLVPPAPPPVAPGARGCACEVPGAANSELPAPSALTAMVAILAWWARRKRSSVCAS